MKFFQAHVAALIRRRLSLAVLCLLAPLGVLAQSPPPPAEPGDGDVASGPLQLVIGQLPLPFAYRVRREEMSVRTTSAFWFDHEVDLLPVDGPRAGKLLSVKLRYVLPHNNPPGYVQASVRRESETFASDARTRAVEPFQSGGFGFVVADTFDEVEQDEERVIRLIANLDGALVNVFIADPDGGEGVSDLFAAAKGFVLDYPRTQRLGKRLQAETARATADGKLLTSIGTLLAPEGFEPTVASSGVVRDGKGHFIASTQSFQLLKSGMMGGKSMGLVVSCGLALPADEKARDELREPYGQSQGSVTVLSRGEDDLGGVPAHRIDITQAEGGPSRKGTYWYAGLGSGYATVTLLNLRGRVQDSTIETQLRAMTPVCRPLSDLSRDPAEAAGPEASKD